MSEKVDGVETAGPGVEGAVASGEVAALRARLLASELKAEAIRAGMVDLDGVKLIDQAALKLTESGELLDGAGVMRALRTAKPWLFGGSSSSVAVAPRAEPPKKKTALEMSVDEWRAARAELLRRR